MLKGPRMPEIKDFHCLIDVMEHKLTESVFIERLLENIHLKLEFFRGGNFEGSIFNFEDG